LKRFSERRCDIVLTSGLSSQKDFVLSLPVLLESLAQVRHWLSPLPTRESFTADFNFAHI